MILADAVNIMRRWSRHSPSCAFFRSDSRETIEGARRKWWNGGLHADLNSLEGAESYVGDELGRCTGRQIKRRLISISHLLSNKIGIELFEVLVASIFERSLRLDDIRQPLIRIQVMEKRTEYPKNVGLHPVKTPRRPSARPILPQASKLPLYIFEST